MRTLFFALTLFLVVPCFAQTPATSTTVTAPAPVTAAPAPVTAAPALTVAAIPAPAPTVIPVATVAAPPKWAQEFLTVISKLPVLGPIVSQVLVYLGIFGSILTALILFLNGVLSSLKGVVNWTGLSSVATWLENLQQSKLMYWLAAFSNVPAHLTPAAVSTPPSTPTATTTTTSAKT